MLHLVEKGIPRFRIGHLYEVFAVPMPPIRSLSKSKHFEKVNERAAE